MSDACRHDWPKPMKTAVLFLIFNRLDTTQRVFEAIRRARPPRLYVASDGPRASRDGESNTVAAVRDYVMNHIDWDCQVKTLFRETNLGCKMAVSSAIDWFFQNEEMGIILEDDCLPTQSFFGYCQVLLNQYKSDMRVWLISGDNFQDGVKRGDGDYYFSQCMHIWGWATWADRWRHYDVSMKSFDLFKTIGQIKNVFHEKGSQDTWMKLFENVSNGAIDTWDYQWAYTIKINSGLSILPNVNLISNIGFDADATHTTIENTELSNLPSGELRFPLKKPTFMVPDREADRYTNKKFGKKSKLEKLKRKLKKITQAVTSRKD